ncbi:MAG: glutamine-hydrolyzing GMP synthase [Candidatus Peregrinibacteria bacterium]|nr:glutamine-hydrolyzing GMP synthase [Candidatus Peregrinibacteria bacterium]
MHEKIIILDFGGQYAHLIASRIRRENVLAEIYEPDDSNLFEILEDDLVKGIILSGGPQSVFADDSPRVDKKIFDLGIPLLGICYGHQFLSHELGGKVEPGQVKEYGKAELLFNASCRLFDKIDSCCTDTFCACHANDHMGTPRMPVWMSHGDEVVKLPEGFRVCGNTKDCFNAAIENVEKNIYGIQFHPEVTHTKLGAEILRNFVKEICGCKGDWTIEKFFDEETKVLKKAVGDKNIFLFVSGGVDSTVAFAFLSKIFGKDRVKGLFVDTGLLREGEVSFVEKSLREIGADLTVLRESDHFLSELKNSYDPEDKRKKIGHAFLDVQHKFFSENDLHDDWLLAQGTIYPDTIETGGTKNSDKIKTHHNRAPEVQKLIDEGKIIEPLKELYKDEVRELGRLLELPANLVDRHPFPGPGLGVRILCAEESINEIPAEKVSVFTLRKDKKPFTILPIKSVGVQGDSRTFKHPAVLKNIETIQVDGKISLEKAEELSTKLINHYSEINRCIINVGASFKGSISEIKVKKSFVTANRAETLKKADGIVRRLLREMNLYDQVWQFPVVLAPISFNNTGEESIILRPVDSIDAMSASIGKLPMGFFASCAKEILKDTNISAVFLDVTSKPPGTIEWE